MEKPNFCFVHRLGPIVGLVTDAGLRWLRLPIDKTSSSYSPFASVRVHSRFPWVDELHESLDRYFAGDAVGFASIPLDLEATTPFRRAVWQAARELRWGETISYGGLAERLGRPGGARAVGQALGANPVPIVVPCHRILAAHGRLGGFGAGLAWKRELLRIEGYSLTCCVKKL